MQTFTQVSVDDIEGCRRVRLFIEAIIRVDGNCLVGGVGYRGNMSYNARENTP